MSSNIYTAGLNNVGSYQVSGAPFVTSSVIPQSGSGHFKVEFPYVTKQITITNNSTTSHDLVRVAFSERGLEDGVANYFLVGSTKDGDGSTTLNVKATELYVMCDDNHTAPVSIFGSLTNLPVSRINNISPSGSNWSGSIGVG
tara:strand:- start:1235 stop:1663 length:429 start_codon:yes stop_codon:yes gene_type:complete